MELTIAPRGILQIDGARIIFRNGSGEPTKFNREGDRNFAVVIPDQEMADMLTNEGWNVKIKAPREEGDEPFMYLPVKIKFNDRGPNVYLQSGDNTVVLDEESVGILDDVDILNVDLDIRPYDWVMASGNSGRTAYLQSIHVTQEVNRFASRIRSDEDDGDLPF
jgi:hypothetical protein